MKIKVIPQLFFFIISCVLLTSCTYESEEVFFNEVSQPSTDYLTISLNNYDTVDTIYIQEGPVNFSYNLNFGNGQFSGSKVIFNGETIRNGGTSGEFEIIPIYTGNFDLRIEFETSSGTGSLAEKVGGEQFQVWRSWVISAYVETIPDKPEITHTVENGYSVISWPPYTKTKFKEYSINTGYGRIYVIKDINTTKWVDSTYTGYFGRHYQFGIENEVGANYSSIDLEANSNSVHFEIEVNKLDSSVALSITKPDYYGVFESYIINENLTRVTEIKDIRDTVVVFKSNSFGINSTSNVTLYYSPKLTETLIASGYESFDASVETEIFPKEIDEFIYNKKLNSILGYANGELNIINPVNFNIIETITVFDGPGFHIPYNSEYVYYSQPKQLVQLNLSTYEDKRIDAITSTYGSGPSNIRGSDKQLVSYDWFGPGDRIEYYTRIYNLESDTEINLEQRSNENIDIVISDDGNYAVKDENMIYQIDENELVTIGALDFSGTWHDFRNDKCDEIIIKSGSTVYIYDSNTLGLIKSINASGTFKTYDVATKNLIYHNVTTGKLYSIHIDTEEEKEFNVNATNFQFVNGTIFLDDLKYLKLY